MGEQYVDEDLGQIGSCQSLWRCFISNFDWTFKEGGAAGSFLDGGFDDPMIPLAEYYDPPQYAY